MKLTKDTLRSLIKEVVVERGRSSMILSESMEDPNEMAAPSSPTYDKIVGILNGQDPSVRTVVIMSGQNPMAQQTDTAKNAMLDSNLKKDLSSMGLEFIPVGGRFDGHDEDSVMILNASRQQAQELNRKYTQWGYVWGESMPNFQMIQIDHNQQQGEGQAPGSKVATSIIVGPQAQAATDNYTYDYESGLKLLIPLY